MSATVVLLWTHALWLMSRCHALRPQDSYYYYNASFTISNQTNGFSSDPANTWRAYTQWDGRVENSEIRANVTQQKWFAGITYVGDAERYFQPGRVSILRLTINGASPTPADADLVITMTDTTDYYFSVMVPLNGEASTYNNSIGPECDTARVPNSTTSNGLYSGNGGPDGIAETGDPLYTNVGARAAEMQPPSKVNAWPIVLEVENHPVEDFTIVRLQTGDSDLVQQCGIGQAFRQFQNYIYFSGGDNGQYLALSGFDIEFWYNDTSSPTTNPTTTPTGVPTAQTEEPTTTPTQEPTGMPTQDPTFSRAPSENPTMGPTVANADSSEANVDDADNGLAIGLGVAGGVVALIIVAAVVYYFMVHKA